MDFMKMTLSNINTSYKRCMTLPELENFMLTGKIEPGLEGQVMHLIDETPTSLLIDAVNQLAAKKNIDAEVIWKNLARVAAEIKSPNKFSMQRISNVKAHLSLSGWNGHLIVALETGAKLTAESGEDMAKQLILAGIFSENLTVTSWKDDVDHAPSGSEIIAIKSALNAYEKKLNGLT
jgi:hypothetical protein